jgi:N-acetylmuramoyl-L-alanine amidase
MIHSGHKGHRDGHMGAAATLCSHVGIYVLFIILSIFSRPFSCAAEDMVDVKGLRYHITSEYLRVVVELSGPVEFSNGKLSGPDRLFLDLKNSKFAKDLQKNYTINDVLVKGIRLGQFNANTVRIVFDLASADYDFKIFSLEDPSRLIIDISAKSGGEKKQTPGNIEKPAEPPTPKSEPPKSDASREADNLHRKIVIDAGHGGHDPGAIGPTGLCEKDVVLAVALKMRNIIKKEYPQYEVILTRDSDVFVPLPERAKIANKNGADFFLSIHANASTNKKARGIETYMLNWTNDEEALKVAARENAISLKRMKQVQSELGVILASLDRDRKRDGSVNLAGHIQRSLVSSITSRHPKVADLGVKQALFYVLVDVEMASALAEISFISNPEEEKLLADEAYRQSIAASLVDGINAYFASEPRQPMVAGGTGQRINYKTDGPDTKTYKAHKIKYTSTFR